MRPKVPKFATAKKHLHHVQSDSEEEVFSEDDTNWELDGITAEEIDFFGRSHYEVMWDSDHWKRADGSSNQWTTLAKALDKNSDPAHLKNINRFNAQKTLERASVRHTGIPVPTTVDFHNLSTRWAGANLPEQAVARRNELDRQPIQKSWAHWASRSEKVDSDDDLETRPSGHTRSGGVKRSSVAGMSKQRSREGSIIPVASTARSSRRPTRHSCSDQAGPSRPANRRMVDSPAASDASANTLVERVRPPMRPRPAPSSRFTFNAPSKPSRAEPPATPNSSSTLRSAPTRLFTFGKAPAIVADDDEEETFGHNSAPKHTEWTRIARLKDSASITFVNDVDSGEEEPPNLRNFTYLEREYAYGQGLQPVENFQDFLLGCEEDSCGDGCTEAETCACQEVYELDEESKTFAYDKKGRWAFQDYYHRNIGHGGEVIECNMNCACPPSCRNRIAQAPRKIPLVVFKTVNRGWGVCSGSPVKKGTVLGVYTGKLITRSAAKKLTGAAGEYTFNLDFQEDVDASDDDDDDKYTVDSKECGNWTRFLNHGCSPNLKTYGVSWDTTPHMNRGYIAFFASRDIEPGEEFTFDYSPHATNLSAANRKGKSKKGKGKATVVVDKDDECRCGHVNCRGAMRV